MLGFYAPSKLLCSIYDLSLWSDPFCPYSLLCQVLHTVAIAFSLGFPMQPRPTFTASATRLSLLLSRQTLVCCIYPLLTVYFILNLIKPLNHCNLLSTCLQKQHHVENSSAITEMKPEPLGSLTPPESLHGSTWSRSPSKWLHLNAVPWRLDLLKDYSFKFSVLC